jgi:hypothetical protein
MRLWTLHPQYLDARGLVALWREALLAQKVLRGATKGYRHHPQLARFRASSNPRGAIASYLVGVFAEAEHRGYRFNAGKIARTRLVGRIEETEGQLLYEWAHLQEKLEHRDPARQQVRRLVKIPAPHPIFRIISGAVQGWERVKQRD